MSTSRLIAVDVHVPLIPEVDRRVHALLAAGHESVRVLFPNRRAVRFYLHHCGPDRALQVQPTSMEELVEELVFSHTDPPPVKLTDMDRWFMLMDLLKDGNRELYQRLGGEPDRVFPWCIRLVGLLDELDMHLVERVMDMPYVDEVVPEAREILENLDRVVEAWRGRMAEGWTGGGDRYRRAVDRVEAIREPVVAAGFGALTGSEAAILDHLFQANLVTIIFQTDLKNRHEPFDPYALFHDWMSGKRWGRKPDETVSPDTDIRRPTMTFHEAFDVHAEATALSVVLQAGGAALEASPTAAAVVVPDSRSLLPVLQVIPQQALNVTAGYPFRRTAFYRLLEACMDLGADFDPHRGVPSDRLVTVLNNPLVRACLDPGGAAESRRAGGVAAIRRSRRSWLDPEAVRQIMGPAEGAGVLSFLDAAVWPFCRVRSIRDLADVVETLAARIQEAIADREAYRLEMDMLARFMETVQHGFLHSRFRDRKFASPRILFQLIRQVAEQVIIRFEGNPLKGLQVMGFLETRLLQFPRLFIVDVIEGVLPREAKMDALLPVSLREVVGLPGEREREAVEAYHFFRLLDGAREAALFYRKGETADNRSTRSRYIEQLLVEAEFREKQEKGELDVVGFEAGSVHMATVNLSWADHGLPEPPVLTGDAVQRLQDYMAKGISPSFLDELIQCPYRLYLNRVVGVPEMQGPVSAQDPREVGTVVHQVLEDAFRPVADGDTVLNRGLLNQRKQQSLATLHDRLLREFPGLSPIRLTLLEELVRFRLTRYVDALANQTDRQEIRVLGVEQDLASSCGPVKLRGKADRIDIVIDENGGEQVVVTDYKTGIFAEVPKGKTDWLNQVTELEQMDTASGLARLRQELRSIQLPLYVWMVSRMRKIPFEQIQARLTLLGSGKEATFKGEAMGEEACFRLVQWLAGRLRSGEPMVPVDDDTCPRCRYYQVCRFTTHQERGGY